jgi:hypothetical protein
MMDKTMTRPQRLVNRKAIKAFLLEYAQRNRAHRFSRVGESVLDDIEAAVRQKCRAVVDSQPSVGKTIK